MYKKLYVLFCGEWNENEFKPRAKSTHTHIFHCTMYRLNARFSNKLIVSLIFFVSFFFWIFFRTPISATLSIESLCNKPRDLSWCPEIERDLHTYIFEFVWDVRRGFCVFNILDIFFFDFLLTIVNPYFYFISFSIYIYIYT